MSLRTFILALAASFGVAWLVVIVIPYLQMRAMPPLPMPGETPASAGVFIPKRPGRVADGAMIYAANGCYLCHTQLVRPTYAGNDLYRPDWGGLKNHPDRGDTRRETNPFDFTGETFAQTGLTRLGPDLSNLGSRLEAQRSDGLDPEVWLYTRLYNPRLDPKLWSSTCPPHPFLFVKKEITGNAPAHKLPIDAGPDHYLVPSSGAKALVSYLLSLRKDQAIPAALDFKPAEKDSDS